MRQQHIDLIYGEVPYPPQSISVIEIHRNLDRQPKSDGLWDTLVFVFSADGDIGVVKINQALRLLEQDGFVTKETRFGDGRERPYYSRTGKARRNTNKIKEFGARLGRLWQPA